MSTRKFVTIIVCAIVLFLIALLPVAIATAEPVVYINAGVVVDINIIDNMVVTAVEDTEGFLWNTKWNLDKETCLELGDTIILFMKNVGTPEVFDDYIIYAINTHIKAQ